MSDRVHVFAGPTLPTATRAQYPEFEFHGPAAQGDIYRLARSHPLAIALVDGYFEHVPSVWHKELLWAMAQGIHLFGAASMGALRAAELADFGMVGVGQIYEDFAQGRLMDDDEVTLVHADASFEYRPVSEAMVNLRATLVLAESEGVLNRGQREQLQRALKCLFYPERSYAALRSLGRERLPRDLFAHLDAWLELPEHRIDQKRTDACLLLARLDVFRSSRPDPLRVRWTFQHTDAWEQVRRNVTASEAQRSSAPAVFEDTELASRARLRALEIESARRDGYVPTPADLGIVAARFRRARGLHTAEGLRDFLERAGLSSVAFEALMAGEACVRRSRLAPSYDLDAELESLARLDVAGESCLAAE